jgi:Domain of unknown function (DUF4145)
VKVVPASVRETAFNCPHCGVLTTQYWKEIFCRTKAREDPLPSLITNRSAEEIIATVDPDRMTDALRKQIHGLVSGMPYIETIPYTSISQVVHNVHISTCFDCGRHSIWLHDRLLYPEAGVGIVANADMPPDVMQDFVEANAIVNISPRGSAALSRLCVQKLCIYLGKSGTNLNNDIGALVSDGLSTRVQQALDAVRAIGNSAVHPGSIDLRDDHATAVSLLRLVNLICEKMLTEPKHVEEVYRSLPATVLAQISRRDGGEVPE